MPIISSIQTSFNAGIYSPLLHGHINAPRRDSAVADSLNMIPTVQGPVTRRGGTKFVFEVKDSAKQTALMPFQFNVEQAFILEMGDQYMRFYKDNEIITETAVDITGITAQTPPVVTAVDHGYTTGDETFIVGAGGMVEINQRSFHLTVLTDDTFSLQDREDVDIVGAGYTTYTSGGTSAKIYEIATSYLQADLFDSDGHFDFRIAQSNDVLYITHHGKNYPISALTRTADTDWAVKELTQTDGPYESLNATTTTLKPSALTGSVAFTVDELDLVTNGTFVTDTDWTKGTGWTIPGGNARVDGTQIGDSDLEQNVTVTNGVDYILTFTIANYNAGTITPQLAGTAGTARTSNGTFTETITAGAGSQPKLELRADLDGLMLLGGVTLRRADELSTNGTFTADTDWTKDTGWTIGSGVASVDASQAADSDLEQNQSVTDKKTYTVVFTISNYVAGTITPRLAGTLGTARSANGTFTENIKAGNGAEPKLEFRADSDGDMSIDDVSVKAVALGVNNDSGFQATDVGRLFRFRDDASNWTWAKITSVPGTKTVIATILGPDLPNTNSTVNWRLGLWSDTTTYPTAVWLYQRRLIVSTGDRLDMTQINGFTNTTVDLAPSDADGTVNADNAISIRLGANQVNEIHWIADHEKALLCGTATGEWVIRANTLGEAITPDNVTADRATREGSAPIQALTAGSAALFIQRARRKLHEIGFNFEADGFRSPDMTLLAEDVTQGGILQTSYQQQPQSIVWMVRADGVLLGFTYERAEGVLAWHRHIIGGSFGSGDSVVEHTSVIPSADTSRDELWLIVKRTIDGVTRRYVEYIAPIYDSSIAQADAIHVDCSLTYSGSETTTVRGLNHLEGETVEIYNEGKAQPTAVVTNGAITIPNELTTTKAQIGLANTWKLETLEIVGGNALNTVQGKPKRIDRVITRYLNTLGVEISGDGVEYDIVTFDNFTQFGTMSPLFTGDKEHPWPGNYNRAGKVYLRGTGAFPATILAIMPRVVTSDR